MSSAYEILVGPSGSGKSYDLYKMLLTEADQNPDKKYMFIVPEQVSLVVLKKLVEMNKAMFDKPGFMNIDIIGFNRFSYRVFEEYGIREETILDEYEKSMLIRVVAGENKDKLRVYKNSIDKQGFISDMKAMISELITYNIDPGDIALISDNIEKDGKITLAAKMADVALIYGGFMDKLRELGSGITEERLKKLRTVLGENKPCKLTDGTVFVFDEFRSFSPDQLSIIEALSHRADKMIFSITIETDYIRNGISASEYDLFYQSSETLKELKLSLGSNPKVIYKERKDGEIDELKFLERNVFRFPIKEYDGEYDGKLELWKNENRETEIRRVAEDIANRVKNGMRYRDFAIVTGDMDAFTEYGEDIFRSYGIPLFKDKSKVFTSNPYVEGIHRLCSIIDKDFDYESVFGFLKCQLDTGISVDNVELLENYVLAHGIRGRRIWNYKIRSRSKDVPDDVIERLALCDSARERFMYIMGPMLKLKKVNTVKTYIAALRECIGSDRLNYRESIKCAKEYMHELGRYDQERVMIRLYDLIDEVLNRTEEFMGSMEMSIHEFSVILRMGMNEISIGIIPPTLDSCIIGETARSRFGFVSTVYFINMNEGVIPSRFNLKRLMSEKDRDYVAEKLSNINKHLGMNAFGRSMGELFSIYLLLSKPTERLVLSYIEVDVDGSVIEPSFVIGRIKRLFPELKTRTAEIGFENGTWESDAPVVISKLREAKEGVEPSDEDIRKMAEFISFHQDRFNSAMISNAVFYENKPKDISKAVMDDLNLQISVSKVETYARCPYSYYLRYILGLRDRDQSEADGLLIGNIVHNVLELTVRDVQEKYGNDWTAVDDLMLEDMAMGHLRDAFAEKYEVFGDDDIVVKDIYPYLSNKNKSMYNNLADMAKKNIRIIKYHINAGNMKPLAEEQDFSATLDISKADGSTMPLVINGKIDRIDSYTEDGKTYIRIIDYKTGNGTFSMEDIDYGMKVQLTTYMDIIVDIMKTKLGKDAVVPEGMYYYKVENPIIELSSISGKYITEHGGTLEAAVEAKYRENFKMSGPSNYDPVVADADKLHGNLNIQEAGVVNAVGEIGKGVIIPVKTTGGGFSKDTLLLGSDDMENLCNYSTSVVKTTAEEIVSGRIPKSPVAGAIGKEATQCAYCDFREACRYYSKYSGPYRRIKSKIYKTREEVEEIIRKTDKTDFKDSRFVDRKKDKKNG